MSSSYSVSIAPYIQIMGNHNVTKKKFKKECSIEGHNKKQQGKFCCDCGSPLIDVPYDEVIKLRPRDILYNIEKHEDDLWSPEGLDSLLVPNHHVPNSIDLSSYNYSKESTIDLTTTDLNDLKQKQISWFYEKYSVCIDELEKSYGAENVLVKWGAIGYWS